jgi:putative endonuclease
MNNGDFYIYAIVSKRDYRIYVGMSQNVTVRIKEHNQGRVTSTKAFIPWELFYSELVGSTSIAREKEKYYKSSAGKRKLHKILQTLDSGSPPVRP